MTYTVTEAAELLGISRTTAYQCVRRGEIPALALGRRIVITRAQLETLLGPLPIDNAITGLRSDR
jgi:excisionase family DNA binding protein